MIRMFYDAAVADAPAAGYAPPSAEVLAAFAKNAVMTEGDGTREIPNVKIEPVVEGAAAATATQTPAEHTTDKKEAQAAPEKQAEAAEPDWRELLKKQPETEVYKHLGLDDKMIGFLQNWKDGGDLKNYFEALSTDYLKMPYEEVMKRQLRMDNPDMPQEDFDEYYRMEVTEKFKLDPDLFTEQEVRRGKILLAAAAKKVRDGLIKQQDTYLLPKAPEQSPGEIAARQQEEAQVAKFKESIETNPFMVDIVKNNAIKIGEGEEAFNYGVEPTELKNILLDSKKWTALLKNEDGTWNVEKQALLAAFARDPKGFLNEMKKHYMILGGKNMIEPIENASKAGATTTTSGEPVMSPAARLAKEGRIVSG